MPPALRSKKGSDPMQAFELTALAERQRRGDELYLEFLRVPALNCGLYVLPAGGEDPQQPHEEDEVYYVISGRGSFTCEGQEREVGPGSILYVEAHAEHRFFDIQEELSILVLFASASG